LIEANVLPLSQTTNQKCGHTASKIAKIGIFWYKFAQKGYTPLSDSFTKCGVMEGVPGPRPHTKFYRSDLKMWAYSRKKSQFLV